MQTVRNPFIVSGYVSADYFCDRKAETAELTGALVNGRNIVIVSPRRMGKTGLIEHCFHQKEIAQGYYTFFVDIYATGSLKELVFMLGKHIFDTLKPKGRKFVEGFFAAIGSLRPAFKLDAVSGEPVFDIGIGEIRKPEVSLEELFAYLEAADKPCLVAIPANRPLSGKKCGSRTAYAYTEMYQHELRFCRKPAPHDAEYFLLCFPAVLPECFVPEPRPHRGESLSQIRKGAFRTGR